MLDAAGIEPGLPAKQVVDLSATAWPLRHGFEPWSNERTLKRQCCHRVSFKVDLFIRDRLEQF